MFLLSNHLEGLSHQWEAGEEEKYSIRRRKHEQILMEVATNDQKTDPQATLNIQQYFTIKDILRRIEIEAHEVN